MDSEETVFPTREISLDMTANTPTVFSSISMGGQVKMSLRFRLREGHMGNS